MGKHHSKEKRNLISKLTNETHFTEEEIRCWYKGFFQDCPNGTLTQRSFLKIYQKFFPDGDSTKFAKLVFRVFDENKDGLIEFDEFIRSLSVTSRGSLEEKLQWAFKLYDLDSDGFITKEEMYCILDAIRLMMGEPDGQSEQLLHNSNFNNSVNNKKINCISEIKSSKERVEMIFQKLDPIKSDKLSLEEFMQGSKGDPDLIKALYMNNLT